MLRSQNRGQNNTKPEGCRRIGYIQPPRRALANHSGLADHKRLLPQNMLRCARACGGRCCRNTRGSRERCWTSSMLSRLTRLRSRPYECVVRLACMRDTVYELWCCRARIAYMRCGFTEHGRRRGISGGRSRPKKQLEWTGMGSNARGPACTC